MSASKDYFKKAEQAVRRGNYDYAIELYLQGLMIDPHASDELRALHRVETLAIQEKGGNPQGGMGVKMKVLPLTTRAKKEMMSKKWEEAVLAWERVVRFQPQSVHSLYQLAVALENFEAIDGAIGIHEEIVELDKTYVESYRKLGRLWGAKGEPEKAISCWEQLKAYKPDDKEAGKAVRDLSAQTMVKQAEDRKAESGDESFKALLKDEDKSEELEKKARVIRTDADRVEAIGYKKEELRADPKNSRLWRELGQLYQDLKKWGHAEVAYKKALEVNPQDLFAPEKLGVLREARLQQEIDELRAKMETSDNGTEVKAQLDAKEAAFLEFRVEEYRRRVKAHPTDYELKMRYGRVLMEKGLPNEAIEQFQKAVKDPKYKVGALSMLGSCFEAKKMYDLARNQYTEALKDVADADSELAKEIKYNLGVVAEKKGEVETAMKWYQEIMAVDISYNDVASRVEKLMEQSQ